MAPLKPVQNGTYVKQIGKHFHNEKVMAPLKRVIEGMALGCIPNFHNEKVMAPLKPVQNGTYVKQIGKHFHNEKVMAPLKQTFCPFHQ